MARRSATSAPAVDPSGGVECRGSFSLHEAFKKFSAEVPAKQIPCRSSPHLMWRWFEVGSPSQPLLVLLHGVCGSAANFFQQLFALRDKGFHVISLQWPAFSSLSSFLSGLDGFLAGIHAQAPPKPSGGENGSNTRGFHFLGAELGGLLALHYAAMRPQIVKSVILCNSFVSTDPLWDMGTSLRSMVTPFFSVLPHAVLRKIVISHFLRPLKPIQVPVAAPVKESGDEDDADDLQGALSRCHSRRPRWGGRYDNGGVSNYTNSELEGAHRNVVVLPQESLEIKNSKEFLIAHLDDLSAADLSARLSFPHEKLRSELRRVCLDAHRLLASLEPAAYVSQLDEGDRLLVLHTLDSGFPGQTEEATCKLFPHAKLATMRTGGPFPFLAAAEEVAMHIELHMRRCGAAATKGSEEAEVPVGPSGEHSTQPCVDQLQNEQWRSQDRTTDFSRQERRQPWGSIGQDIRKHTSLCSTTTGSRAHQACWSTASQEYRQSMDYWDSHLSHPANPSHHKDMCAYHQNQEQSRYPRRLPQPLTHPDGTALWERTGASCTSSSQSSSESCFSTGNPQSPVADQANLHSRTKQLSESGPRASEYLF